jgi:hypothetical protein
VGFEGRVVPRVRTRFVEKLSPGENTILAPPANRSQRLPQKLLSRFVQVLSQGGAQSANFIEAMLGVAVLLPPQKGYAAHSGLERGGVDHPGVINGDVREEPRE